MTGSSGPGATLRLAFPVRRREEPNTACGGGAPLRPQLVTRVARRLALAHHIDRLVESRQAESEAAVSRALGITRARLSQIMALLRLAPGIQERLLSGDLALGERDIRIVFGAADWPAQEEVVSALEVGSCVGGQ